MGQVYIEVARPCVCVSVTQEKVEKKREKEGCTLVGAGLRQGATMCARHLYKVMGVTPSPLPLGTPQLEQFILARAIQASATLNIKY